MTQKSAEGGWADGEDIGPRGSPWCHDWWGQESGVGIHEWRCGEGQFHDWRRGGTKEDLD